MSFKAKLRAPVVRLLDSLLGRVECALPQVRELHEGLAPLSYSGTLCLFSSWDPHGIVDDTVLYYLKRLSALNMDIVFVSTSRSLRPQDIEKLRPLCRKIILRRNVGLDFGSWKTALQIVGKYQTYSKIICANDSVFGPLFDLEPIFQRMGRRNLDLWGMIDSPEIAYHLNSWFLVFESTLIRSSFFENFWEKVLYLRSKTRVIRDYEIGLSQGALKQGYKIGAHLNTEAVTRDILKDPAAHQYSEDLREKRVHNLTLYFWNYLLERQSFPFLKTELLKRNRFGSKRILHWEQILASQTTYPVDLIKNHVVRVGGAAGVV